VYRRDLLASPHDCALLQPVRLPVDTVEPKHVCASASGVESAIRAENRMRS